MALDCDPLAPLEASEDEDASEEEDAEGENASWEEDASQGEGASEEEDNDHMHAYDDQAFEYSDSEIGTTIEV